jgi:hypothetical protein
LRKALEARLPVVLVVNKIDRPDARSAEVVDEVYALFLDLDADESQIDFPIVYCNARAGQASLDPDPESLGPDLQPLLDLILEHIPPPTYDEHHPLQALVTNLDASPYVGRLALCRVQQGRITRAQQVAWCRADGTIERAKVTELYVTDSEAANLRVFTVTADGLTDGRVFAECSAGVFDGIRLDTEGRIWAAAGARIHGGNNDRLLSLNYSIIPAFCSANPRHNRRLGLGKPSVYAYLVGMKHAKKPRKAHGQIKPRSLTNRARITNNGGLLPTIDGRSVWARRMHDLLYLHLSDLGGEDNCSEAEKALVRRSSCLIVELEHMEMLFAD